ncbi:MAG: helix-turn-helix domain-containing protein [Bacteroidetes bacterium]|nr:helix-turn-helix domain-containing protein [Bacteroidota bacterium]
MNTNEITEKLDNIEKALKDNAAKPMCFEEASKYLNLSKSHLYKLTSTGVIPHYKPGGKIIYFEKSELDEWILSKPVRCKSQIDRLANKYMNNK